MRFAPKLFLSTPSGWRATGIVSTYRAYLTDFYPRPPGGGRHGYFDRWGYKCNISIHALRVEGDIKQIFQGVIDFVFLSTPSGWRATHVCCVNIACKRFLSTPSGWRATIISSIFPRRSANISIHALRVEGDGHIVLVDGFGKLFLSTPSGWRATKAHGIAVA